MVADDVRKHERNCGVEQGAHLEKKRKNGSKKGTDLEFNRRIHPLQYLQFFIEKGIVYNSLVTFL
jgi:hypothetical protein